MAVPAGRRRAGVRQGTAHSPWRPLLLPLRSRRRDFGPRLSSEINSEINRIEINRINRNQSIVGIGQ
jgi:hypothetical protein